MNFFGIFRICLRGFKHIVTRASKRFHGDMQIGNRRSPSYFTCVLDDLIDIKCPFLQ